MRYIGGKCRQAKAIVEAARRFRWTTYVEPFCGGMWSAMAMIQAFPRRRYLLSDHNPWLIAFWKAGVEDKWDPPDKLDLATYNWYKEHKPLGDPMTAYVGFAWSFGGKFFGGLARDAATGQRDFGKGSYQSTMKKLTSLRNANVRIACADFVRCEVPLGSLLYLDPPYQNRTHQTKMSADFDYDRFYRWAEAQTAKATVLTTSFKNPRDYSMLHDYGDTVVRHLNAKAPDGTRELLLHVRRPICV